MPSFHENWFPARSQQALANLVRDVEHVPGRLIEIGSWEGCSTIAMANATKRTVHAVDTWEGCDSDVSGERARERDVYVTWRRNIDEATDDNVTEHRMDWRRYRDQDDSPVALLFIDAEHTYDEVYAQIERFLPLMAKGGVMCGDDVSHPPVWQAVTDWFEAVEVTATLWVVRL